jgi:hypothetical protein
MRQLRSHFRFAQEAGLDLGAVGELRRQQLHCDRALEARVARAIHDAHAAAAEFTLDLVLRGESTLDTRQQFCVGGGVYRIRHVGPAKRDRITISVG